MLNACCGDAYYVVDGDELITGCRMSFFLCLHWSPGEGAGEDISTLCLTFCVCWSVWQHCSCRAGCPTLDGRLAIHQTCLLTRRVCWCHSFILLRSNSLVLSHSCVSSTNLNYEIILWACRLLSLHSCKTFEVFPQVFTTWFWVRKTHENLTVIETITSWMFYIVFL